MPAKALAATSASLGLGLAMLMASPLMRVYGIVALVFAGLALVPFVIGWFYLSGLRQRRAVLIGAGFAAVFAMAQGHVQITSLRNTYLDAVTIALGALCFLEFLNLVNPKRETWLDWLFDAGLSGTLVTTSAAFVSGSVQFAGAMAAVLGIGQIFIWLMRGSSHGIAFRMIALFLACGVPLLLTFYFHIGHALALPWVVCHLTGATLLWHDFLRRAATAI